MTTAAAGVMMVSAVKSSGIGGTPPRPILLCGAESGCSLSPELPPHGPQMAYRRIGTRQGPAIHSAVWSANRRKSSAVSAARRGNVRNHKDAKGDRRADHGWPCQNPNLQAGRLELKTNHLAFRYQPAKRIRFRHTREFPMSKVDRVLHAVPVPAAHSFSKCPANLGRGNGTDRIVAVSANARFATPRGTRLCVAMMLPAEEQGKRCSFDYISLNSRIWPH